MAGSGSVGWAGASSAATSSVVPAGLLPAALLRKCAIGWGRLACWSCAGVWPQQQRCSYGAAWCRAGQAGRATPSAHCCRWSWLWCVLLQTLHGQVLRKLARTVCSCCCLSRVWLACGAAWHLLCLLALWLAVAAAAHG